MSMQNNKNNSNRLKVETIMIAQNKEIELAKTPLHKLIFAYEIVAKSFDLLVLITPIGIMAEKKDFDKANEIIQNSVLYN